MAFSPSARADPTALPTLTLTSSGLNSGLLKIGKGQALSKYVSITMTLNLRSGVTSEVLQDYLLEVTGASDIPELLFLLIEASQKKEESKSEISPADRQEEQRPSKVVRRDRVRKGTHPGSQRLRQEPDEVESEEEEESEDFDEVSDDESLPVQ
jgi:hypothetical protein